MSRSTALAPLIHSFILLAALAAGTPSSVSGFNVGFPRSSTPPRLQRAFSRRGGRVTMAAALPSDAPKVRVLSEVDMAVR